MGRHDSGCVAPAGECSGACMGSPDANVEVVRQLLLDRSKVGLAKFQPG